MRTTWAGVAAVLVMVAAPVPATAEGPTASVVGLLAGSGAGDVNRTAERFAVRATDLGVMWRDSRGRTAIAFGDTYGDGWGGNGAGPDSADWRFNVLAHSSDTTPADGLRIDSMVTDRPGHAKQLLGKDPSVSEITVIPTAGVSVGSRDYLHFMSVRHWGPAGTWTTNYAGIAYSDDGGETWVKSPARFANNGGTSRFQLGAFVRDGGYVYLFGTPNGRLGNAYLARVPEARVLDLDAYRYWGPSGWTVNADNAIPVMTQQVGELSAQYNSFLGRWVAMHLDEQRQAVVLRTAPSPTGPWTGGQVVAHAADHPGLYGAYLYPGNTSELYFAMSSWGPYHVRLMKTSLSGLSANLARNGGFEDRSASWTFTGQGGVDRGLGLSRSGANNGWVRNTSGWNDMRDNVVLEPGRRYRLTGWARTSASNTDGYFGVRTAGRVLAETKFGHLPGYSKLTVEFTGATGSAEVFAGTWALHGDTWVQLDDVLLEQIG